jgi:CxxC motif-containing protein
MTDDRISHYLCIGCPLGCRLEVEEDERDTIVEVRGWSCKKGERYGRQEHTDPRRMVTTTVGIEGASLARLPVKTSRSVPKDQVGEVCRLLRSLKVAAPVRMGDVVLADIAGSGADVVATRDLS